MKHLYAKMTFRIILISFLAFMLIGCGESGTPGGGTQPGQTAVISLNIQNDSLPADGSSSTAVTVALKDSSGNAVDVGTSVKLNTTMGTFPNGKKEYRLSTPDDSGVVTLSLIAETMTGDAVVTAVSNNITQKVTISFTGDIIIPPVFLSLGSSSNSVRTTVNADDTSRVANIVAVVLDEDRAPIEGVSVFFTTISSDGTTGAGQISASSLLTDENGEAIVQFTAGVEDKRNQVVTIEARVDGVGSKQIPIKVTGSYLEVSAEGETNIEIGMDSVLKVAVFDADSLPVYDAPVNLSLASVSTGAVSLNPASGKTDVNGEFQATLTGTIVGDVGVQVESLGALGLQAYVVDDPNKAFRIDNPSTSITGIGTSEDLIVTVLSPGYDKVIFAASVGGWDDSSTKVIEKTVTNGTASAVFSSADAGTSTIQVYPAEAPAISDSIRVVVSAPSSEASKIRIQSSSSVVGPSTSAVKNSVTLFATVTNDKNQVVKGAPVLFGIQNPTGGGEYVAPAIAFTDDSGIATSVFISGSLVAGAAGVRVTGELISNGASDLVSIIISGQSASVSIGRSSEIESINNGTAYRLPMSVLVTDSNGSPVNQGTVSLNLWASHYSLGVWERVYPLGVFDNIRNYVCEPVMGETRVNEDLNKNLILDPGEDINLDGELTPPPSMAGEVPAILVTDENGVAEFDLIYLKAAALWVKDEITATTVVSGTEASSTYRLDLPYLRSDSEECVLPDSPFFFEDEVPQIGGIIVSAGAETIVADGTSTSVIRASVLATNGEPMADKVVTFSTTLGSFTSAPTVPTDVAGIAMITLKSSTAPGTAVVTADVEGFTGQDEIIMTASEPDNISITAIPNPVVPGGNVTLIATLADEFGNPVAGESLNFSVTQNNTGGSLSGVSATTDVNGQATLVYTAGTLGEGVDQIKVILNSNQSISSTVNIEVEAADFVVGSITLDSANDSIPADDSSSTAITATVLDSLGQAVPKGTVITFTTTLGSLSGGGTTISRQTADDSGVVVVSLTAGTITGTAEIKATCLGVSQSITVEFSGGGLTVSQIEVRIVDTVLDADGASQTSVIATVKTATNQAIENAEVIFETTGGTITSPHKTDASGQATAVITSDRWNREDVNRVEVTARSQGVFDTATMAFSGVSISLTAIPDSLLTTETSTIFATLLDAAGKPIADEFVTFTTDKGTITSTATTNSSGVAMVSTTSDQSGTATVEASSRNATGTTTVNYGSYLLKFINPDPLDPYYPGLNSAPISVNGGTKDLTIALYDFGTTVVLVGESIHFSTSLGSLSSPNPVITAGPAGSPPYAFATIELTAGAQTGQAVVDAEVTISGDSTVLRTQTTVLILADDASKIVLTPNPGIINVNNGVSTIRAVVYDADDNPVPFQNVYFRINNAPGGGEYLSNSSAVTNIAGIAEVQFYAGGISSISIDDIEIEASTDSAFPSPMGLCRLTIAGPVSAISVSVNLQELVSPGIEQGHLEVGVSAIATDINGNPVADGTQVYFGVSSIGFDEDRDDDGIINCYDDPDQVNPISCPGLSTGLGTDFFSDDVNYDGAMYSFGTPGAPAKMCDSEDALSNGGNENGILDPGEDKNGNGVMDPVQGCTIQSPKSTTLGITTATLNYPMSFADNIKVRLTAESGGVSNFYDYVLLCTEAMVDAGTCGLGY